MRGKKNRTELVRRSLRLDKDDLDWFQRTYSSVGYNEAIRRLMKAHRASIDRAVSTRVPALNPEDLTVISSQLQGEANVRDSNGDNT